MNDAQWKFVHSEILTMSVMAAFAHVGVYASGTPDAERRSLQETLKRELRRLSDQYQNAVSDDQHSENIQNLATTITNEHRKFLKGGAFRFGPAQKALNLYLKYLWCFDHIAEPPHCPLDARILAKAPELSEVLWTRLNSADEYIKCIHALRKIAGAESLAQWECEQFEQGRKSNQSLAH